MTLKAPELIAYGRQWHVRVDSRSEASEYTVSLTGARLEYLAPDGRVFFSKQWREGSSWDIDWSTPIGPFASGDGPVSVRLRYTQHAYERPEGCEVELTKTVTPSAGLAPAAVELNDGYGGLGLRITNAFTCARTRGAPMRVVLRREGRRTVWRHADFCDEGKRWSRTGPADSFRPWPSSGCGDLGHRCNLGLALVGNRSRRFVYRVDAYLAGRRVASGSLVALIEVHPTRRIWDVPGGDDEFDTYCIESVNEELDIPIHEENGRAYCNAPRWVDRRTSLRHRRPVAQE